MSSNKDVYLEAAVAEVRRRYGFKLSKKLGQNFITDAEVVEDIVDSSSPDGAFVVEIGPGIGTMTRPLAERADRLAAIELDDRLIPILKQRLSDLKNIEIIHGDVLETDLDELTKDAENVRIVGNLPYYITTPIIMSLLKKHVRADSITVMMQKEVADRLLAEPGTRKAGAITYAVHYYCDVKKVRDVSRDCFYPAPEVDSTVITMEPLQEPRVKVSDEEFFFSCIKAGFSQRRKTVLNSLQSIRGFDKSDIARALEGAGIDPRTRAEKLSLEDFARITENLKEGCRL